MTSRDETPGGHGWNESFKGIKQRLVEIPTSWCAKGDEWASWCLLSSLWIVFFILWLPEASLAQSFCAFSSPFTTFSSEPPAPDPEDVPAPVLSGPLPWSQPAHPGDPGDSLSLAEMAPSLPWYTVAGSSFHALHSAACPATSSRVWLTAHLLWDVVPCELHFWLLAPPDSLIPPCLYICCFLFSLPLFGQEFWSFEVQLKRLPFVKSSDHNSCIPRGRVPWTARRSSQSILKEIDPECSLEGLMLKVTLQYFGHLMRRANILEKTLMLGKTEGRRRRGRQRMRWLDGIINGHEFEHTPGDSEGQRSLACCSPWHRKESDMT